MAGAVAIVVALLVFPIVFLLSMTAVASALGSVLFRSVEERHEGSELLDTNI
jgi:hypothetical protein